jgi:hypothetical protein
LDAKLSTMDLIIDETVASNVCNLCSLQNNTTKLTQTKLIAKQQSVPSITSTPKIKSQKMHNFFNTSSPKSSTPRSQPSKPLFKWLDDGQFKDDVQLHTACMKDGTKITFFPSSLIDSLQESHIYIF